MFFFKFNFGLTPKKTYTVNMFVDLKEFSNVEKLEKVFLFELKQVNL